MFTRFGARLEASMEMAIRRGRVLRQILKQECLSPLSSEFQMAWLVAFNDGLFNDAEPEDIASQLALLESRIKQTGLTLNSSREQWIEAVTGWLGQAQQP